jgi:hypothetical protein
LASKNTNTLASLARVFFILTDNFYIFGKLISDLVSENVQLISSLACVLKNLSTHLQAGKRNFGVTMLKQNWPGIANQQKVTKKSVSPLKVQ